MKDNQPSILTNEVLIADALLRLKAIQNILIAKGIFTEEEFNKETKVIAESIAKVILQNANITTNVDELFEKFSLAQNIK